MAVIQKNIRLVDSRGSSKELALFDTGATYSCISPDLARELDVVVRIPEPSRLDGIGTAKNGESRLCRDCY